MNIPPNTLNNQEEKNLKKKGFSALLDENLGKAAPSHLEKLLKPSASKENIIIKNDQDKLDKRMQKIEHMQSAQIQESLKALSHIPDKINRLEGLIEVLLIKNNELGKNQLEHKPAPTMHEIIFKQNKKLLAAVASIILLTIILVASMGEEAPKMIEKDYAITLKRVNLRQGPGTEHATIQTVSPNHKMEVLSSDSGWNEVLFVDHINKKEIKGWAFGQLLKIEQVKVALPQKK